MGSSIPAHASLPASIEVLFLIQDSQPKYFLTDADSDFEHQKYGLCGDIYRVLQTRLKEKNINSEVRQKYLPIKRIMSNVENKASNVFCGAGRNASREQRFIYSKLPVYHVSNVVASHRDDGYNPSSYDDLKVQQGEVGALYGTSSARFLKDKIGMQPNDRFLDISAALKAVANKKVRYFYYHDLGLNYLVPASKLPLRVVPVKLRSTPQWMIYSKHMSPELTQLLDNLLKDMTDSGELKAINQLYLSL
jgi:ABC-type amino acid transport substrate-binding protein